jgi:hypothetical protein
MTASCSLGNLPAHNIIPLIPAQAGIQYACWESSVFGSWVPDFAGTNG